MNDQAVHDSLSPCSLPLHLRLYVSTIQRIPTVSSEDTILGFVCVQYSESWLKISSRCTHSVMRKWHQFKGMTIELCFCLLCPLSSCFSLIVPSLQWEEALSDEVSHSAVFALSTVSLALCSLNPSHIFKQLHLPEHLLLSLFGPDGCEHSSSDHHSRSSSQLPRPPCFCLPPCCLSTPCSPRQPLLPSWYNIRHNYVDSLERNI